MSPTRAQQRTFLCTTILGIIVFASWLGWTIFPLSSHSFPLHCNRQPNITSLSMRSLNRCVVQKEELLYSARQKTLYDCGPASLKMLLELHGIKVDLDVIVRKVKTNLRGSSLFDLQRVGREHGLFLEG